MTTTTRKAAIIGGGVIGGGWAARFLLSGWDVRVFDPDPQAPRKIGEVLANARASLPALADVPMPPEGCLTFCDTVQDAVQDVDYIQESVSERLDLKHRVYAEIQKTAPDTPLGSSTSGFKPSELQENAANPASIFVAHPFNPVYLLPLAEVVPSPKSDQQLIEKAKEILREIGMFPLHVRKEIDAHIADRFLEAVWREALWLVKDGIATTEEIDEAIRMGFGLRWGQMGLFETYRIAGGEAGMKHFMAQFGPCLTWPWTKLMDVPEFNDDLVDLIAGQSDAQSGHLSIRELERIRDNNLVAMMRALKAQGWGAGAILKGHDARLKAGTELVATAADLTEARPVVTFARAVPLDWTDFNGHMTESRYLDAFGQSTDRFMELIGCDAAYIAAGGSYFTAETHIRHIDEVHAGARIEVRTQMLKGEGKKLHLFHSMYEGERLLATGESFLLHVNLATRRSCEPGPKVAEGLALMAKAHGGLPYPEGAGAAIRRP